MISGGGVLILVLTLCRMLLCITGLAAAIVLSGPCGVGKSAAVQAIALELGYYPLEINPGMDRSAANLSKNILEATQSR